MKSSQMYLRGLSILITDLLGIIGRLALILACLCFAEVAAQPENLLRKTDVLASKMPGTVIYLQTSKGIYERGEEIWLKAYVMDSQLLAPSLKDTTLFVGLLPIDSSMLLRERLVVNNGFASGHLFIPNTVQPGDYLLAAFTRHSFLGGEPEFKAFRRLKIMNRNDRTVATAEEHTDTTAIAFFPEGGNLVAGMRNVVAFKASGTGGRPADIQATLFEDGRPVSTFKSIHQGMGKFQFTPLHGRNYFVKIAASDRSYALPPVKASGLMLSLLQNTGKHFTFLVTKSRDAPWEKLYVSAQMRGTIYALYQGNVKNDSLTFNLPADKFPPGIAEVTLYDEALQPLAERLIYVNPDGNLTIRATLSKDISQPKDKVKINIKATGANGKPVVAHLGLSVYDSFYDNPADRLNIISYTQLSSQIRGKIWDPDHYFDPQNANRVSDLDLLLLTQGWRRYIWGQHELKQAVNRKVILENMLSGTVKSKAPLPSTLLAVAPDGPGGMHPIPVLPTGHFRLDMQTMFNERIYLKPLGDEQVGKQARLTLNEPFRLIGNMLGGRKIVSPDFTVIPKPLAYRPELSGAIALDEFMVKGKGKAFTDRYMTTLDSLAKFNWNTDYVGTCQWLNCASCGHGTKPVEGIAYSRFRDGRAPQHGPFNPAEVIKEPYHYPVYTEEELLAKFNLYRANGYQKQKEFYQPDYEQFPDERKRTDSRSTLIWAPEVVTDENGEASVSFYCSDVTGAFVGKIEGLNAAGQAGFTQFSLTVSE